MRRVWRGWGWGPGRLRWADRDFLHQDSLMNRGCSCPPQLILNDKPRHETQMVKSSQKGCGKYQASVTLAEGGHMSPSLAVSSQCRQDSGRCNRVCRLQGSTLPRALRKQSNQVLLTAGIAPSLAGGASGVPVIARISEKRRWSLPTRYSQARRLGRAYNSVPSTEWARLSKSKVCHLCA